MLGAEPFWSFASSSSGRGRRLKFNVYVTSPGNQTETLTQRKGRAPPNGEGSPLHQSAVGGGSGPEGGQVWGPFQVCDLSVIWS